MEHSVVLLLTAHLRERSHARKKTNTRVPWFIKGQD